LYVLSEQSKPSKTDSEGISRKQASKKRTHSADVNVDDDEMIDAFIPFKTFKRNDATGTRAPSQLSGRRMLVSEHRKINAIEREESFVVQYMASGGIRQFANLTQQVTKNKPFLVASSVHSGSGQQTFGYSVGQRSDIMLAFFDASAQKNYLCFHNYHGHMWHYIGHQEGCPLNVNKTNQIVVREITSKMDLFRSELAAAWSDVRPDKLAFDYSVSFACQMFHGMPVASLDKSTTKYYCVKECLLSERKHDSWFPRSERVFEHEHLKQAIMEGSVTGFVTLKGGQEKNLNFTDPAGTRFGFCVQAHAPSSNAISSFTKDQIAEFFSWGNKSNETEACAKRVEDYIKKQSARTINSGTFHVEETISTTYLQWLMVERNFDDFEISHFLAYEFRNWSKDFLEPVLQKRHECKQKGDSVAAECLKLIGNGSFGYNGLESSNYDSVHLLTEQQLHKKLMKSGPFHHRKLKPIIRLGVVRVTESKKAKKQKKRRGRKRKFDLLDDEADDSDTSENASGGENDDDEGLTQGEMTGASISNAVAANDDSKIEDYELDHSFEMSHYKQWRVKLRQAVMIDRSLSTPLVDLNNRDKSDVTAPSSASIASSWDHTYASREQNIVSSPKKSYSYHFLYLVTLSGEEKKINNNLAKAVAVLSNSKRLFLGHLSTMFRCLDPCLAELTYVDTDSCIWSLSKPSLESCVLANQQKYWESKNVMADERAKESCHGKMKLEGMFAAGQFRTVKIYRLYKEEEETSAHENHSALKAAYTRCKGVNRYIATRLPNEGFNSLHPQNIVVHRNALRPTKTGEIHIVHEARSVSCPFNLKRFVCEDGYHTLPFFCAVNK